MIRTIAELNLPPVLENFAAREQGFFLVVGPVGQGKTTTLAALIEKINKSAPSISSRSKTRSNTLLK
jgi:twitching motility protein PilT